MKTIWKVLKKIQIQDTTLTALCGYFWSAADQAVIKLPNLTYEGNNELLKKGKLIVLNVRANITAKMRLNIKVVKYCDIVGHVLQLSLKQIYYTVYPILDKEFFVRLFIMLRSPHHPEF